jgi:hypothetical protein
VLACLETASLEGPAAELMVNEQLELFLRGLCYCSLTSLALLAIHLATDVLMEYVPPKTSVAGLACFYSEHTQCGRAHEEKYCGHGFSRYEIGLILRVQHYKCS